MFGRQEDSEGSGAITEIRPDPEQDINMVGWEWFEQRGGRVGDPPDMLQEVPTKSSPKCARTHYIAANRR